jgi:hypothetical protein
MLTPVLLARVILKWIPPRPHFIKNSGLNIPFLESVPTKIPDYELNQGRNALTYSFLTVIIAELGLHYGRRGTGV